MAEPQLILDTKVISKPKSWDGSKEEWRRWSFQLRNYCQVLSPNMGRWMEMSERVAEPIRNEDLAADQQRASLQLHSILALLLKGSALDALMSVPAGQGFEAWRRLNADNEPRAIGHRRGLLLKLLQPTHLEGSFIQKCQKWEREYLDCRALGGSELNEEVKMSVLQAVLCPRNLQEHLTFTAERYNTWELMRDEIHRVIVSKDGIAAHGGPAPMEIGALGKGKPMVAASKGK